VLEHVGDPRQHVPTESIHDTASRPGGGLVRRAVEEMSDLAHEIAELPLIDTHEHLLAESEWVEHGPDILQDLFVAPYIQADLRVAGADPDALERLCDPAAGDVETRFAAIQDAWDSVQHTGFGEAVRLTAREIYGIDELTPVAIGDRQGISATLRSSGERLRLLAEVARLDHVQIDSASWIVDAEPSAPEFFLHDLSWFRFCDGEIETETILAETGVEVGDLDDLGAAMAAIFRRFGPRAVAVKSQHAYHRTLLWRERSDDEARAALTRILAAPDVDRETRLTLGDWCWARGVELAIEHDLPFKIHVGYHAGTGSMPIDWVRPANLCALLARYPEARFVLMHAGYPYGDELIALAKHYPNVWVDLCWAWALNPFGTRDFVRRFVHAAPITKVFAFGGDTVWPTGVVGYALQARQWLTRALEAEVAAGDLTERSAAAVARRVMYGNQDACFDLARTRAGLLAVPAGHRDDASAPRSS
jgi:uncharacterized protein